METNLLEFSKGKFRFLCLRRNNPMHQYRLWFVLLESSSVEKELRVLMDKKFTMSHQCALVTLKTKGISRCVKKTPYSRLRLSSPTLL